MSKKRKPKLRRFWVSVSKGFRVRAESDRVAHRMALEDMRRLMDRGCVVPVTYNIEP